MEKWKPCALFAVLSAAFLVRSIAAFGPWNSAEHRDFQMILDQALAIRQEAGANTIQTAFPCLRAFARLTRQKKHHPRPFRPECAGINRNRSTGLENGPPIDSPLRGPLLAALVCALWPNQIDPRVPRSVPSALMIGLRFPLFWYWPWEERGISEKRRPHWPVFSRRRFSRSSIPCFMDNPAIPIRRNRPDHSCRRMVFMPAQIPVGKSKKSHGIRNFFARCPASALTPKVSVA